MTTHTHQHDGRRPPRLHRAVLTLPVTNARQRSFVSWLQDTLASLPCAVAESYPIAELRVRDESISPNLAFDDDCRLMLAPEPEDDDYSAAGSTTHAVIAHDTLAPCVPHEQIRVGLEGIASRLNHVGVVVPETRREKSGWDAMIARLGKTEWLYRLETGTSAEILFLLPVTPQEYSGGALASGFRDPRPMIELCCSDATPCFTLHFNLETRLTRAELLQHFSGYAVFKPGDEAFFLSVCAASPWAGLTIYFDLSYADPGSVLTSRELIMDMGRRQL